jgi:hypothetical protein
MTVTFKFKSGKTIELTQKEWEELMGAKPQVTFVPYPIPQLPNIFQPWWNIGPVYCGATTSNPGSSNTLTGNAGTSIPIDSAWNQLA